MTSRGPTPDIDELEFLRTRHDRIVESQMTINQIIHTTFYISVVVIAGTAGVIPQFDNLLSRVVLYLAAALLFLGMYGWTTTYLTSREGLTESNNHIVDTVEDNGYTFENFEAKQFFSRTQDFNREWWEPRKEEVLKLYYLSVAGLAIVALGFDLWGTLSAGGPLVCLP